MTVAAKSRVVSSVLAAVLGAALVLASCSDRAAHARRYHCPMHPTYLSDRLGDCPICGMRLVPVSEGEGARTSAAVSPPSGTAIAPEAFLCPMHPEVGSQDSQSRCPKCGMRLAPRDDVLRDLGVPAAETPRHPLPRDMAPVDVTPDAARLAGILTVPVERGTVARSVRTVGAVVADETRVRHVHSRTAGWVERLHVNFTGQIVRAGEPMLSLYSQELLATQEEYLRARESAARFASSRLAEVRRGGEDLLSAARRRLELFDVPAAFIEELDRSGTARRAVPLLAPVSGHVTVKGVSEGQQVEPGTELFVITDLSRVWIEADFYEYEAPTLALGQAATITLPYDPSTVLAGRIAYVYPTLHAETRAVRVRFEVPNPETALKPGMFADVELAAGRASGLVVPDSAVMDTGTRQVVFVASGPGRYVPREVRTGIRSAGVAEVTAGLAEGEQVVVKANFLLDSESRLRAALTAASSGTSRTPAAVPDHGRH